MVWGWPCPICPRHHHQPHFVLEVGFLFHHEEIRLVLFEIFGVLKNRRHAIAEIDEEVGRVL